MGDVDDMKYCIDDKIIIELAKMLEKTLTLVTLSGTICDEHVTEAKVLLKRVKNKQYDLTSERRLL